MQQYLKIGPLQQENNNQYENYSFFFPDVYLFFQDIHKTTTQNQQSTPTDYFIFNIVITYIRLYANIKAGIIDSSQPINTYRIVYTQNGKKTLVKVTKKIRLWNDFIRFKT
jgi:hypothetical protein